MVRLAVKTSLSIESKRDVADRCKAPKVRPRRRLSALAALVALGIAASHAHAQSTAEPPKITVVQPKAQAITNSVELTGNAAAVNSVKLVARVEGYLEKQNFADGAVVKQGDLLFTIQQDQYKAQLIQAQAQVQGANAAIEYARTETTRYRALVKQDAAAQTEVDHWVYERASAEAKLLSAQAQVTLAQLNLGYTEVKAPFDGQMSKAQIYPGNVVGSPKARLSLRSFSSIRSMWSPI
jgi:RND family efflux transporter MFP subunit